MKLSESTDRVTGPHSEANTAPILPLKDGLQGKSTTSMGSKSPPDDIADARMNEVFALAIVANDRTAFGIFSKTYRREKGV